MADESLHMPSNQNLDYYIITLFQRFEAMSKDSSSHRGKSKHNMQKEIRTFKFWRSIFAEFLASFLYVFIVCGAAAGAGVGASTSSVLLATAMASGFVVTTLTQCFSHISGSHINPAVTLGNAIIGAVSPFRAVMYIAAQCGGAITGAGLLQGTTVPGYQSNLAAAISHSSTLAPWERFGIETILTFFVVLTYFMSTDSYKSYFGVSSLAIGAVYTACSFVSMPYLNPARSFGPSFVLNIWDNHWVYWVGPMVGGVCSGIAYKYVFNPSRDLKSKRKDMDQYSTSMNSDDDTNFDLELDKVQQPKFPGSTYRSPTGTLGQQNSYCQNLYSTGITSKFDQVEPLYGGTRSMYCKSPPLTRANLNRSQSVYAKSNTAINREFLPRAGPLVPAQSLYPLRINQSQSTHLQNQNVQNQMQQRSESIYGIRSSMRQERPVLAQQEIAMNTFQSIYGTRNNPSPGDNIGKFEQREPHRELRDEAKMFVNRSHRPDSMYGATQRRGQSTQSDDSSYGSYHGPTPPSSTPLSGGQPSRQTNGCELVMPANGGGYNTQVQMRQQNGQPERKPNVGVNGSDRQQTYGTVGTKPPPLPTVNGAPLTHQYNMQTVR